MWTCPKCANKVDREFEVCWNCGTSEEGVEDPSFVKADDAPPMPNSPDFIGNEPTMGPPEVLLVDRPVGPFGEVAPEQPLELVECYWANDAMEAQFLAETMTAEGIPAVGDDDLLRQGFGPASFGVPYFRPRVRVRSRDLERARDWLKVYEARRRQDHHDVGTVF